MKTIALSFFLFFSIGLANAEGYIGNAKIKIMQSQYGTWVFSVEGANANPDACEKSQTILPVSYPEYDNISNLLLTAYNSAKTVNVHVKGCDANGYKKFNFIYMAWN